MVLIMLYYIIFYWCHIGFQPSDVCAVHRAVHPHLIVTTTMTSQKGVQAHRTAAKIGAQSKGIPWLTCPCQIRLGLRLEKRVDCAGVSQPIVVIDCLVHHLCSHHARCPSNP